MDQINMRDASFLKDPSLFRQQAYVAGQWVDADDGKTLAVTDPSTGETIGNVPDLGASETRRAIEAADGVRGDLASMTAHQRSALLRRWFDLIIANADDLAGLLTLEQGKPLAEAHGELRYGASFVEWYAEEAKRIIGDVQAGVKPGGRKVVLLQPVGVVAAITPWNFPIAMITRKCAPALAAGCPVVIKPSELTPYCALALAELASRAGFPAGSINVVTGRPTEIGGELTSSPLVRKLSFTGSTAVGKLLIAQCAGTVKKVSMELGGNAPLIVFDDADLGVAVEAIMAGKFRNAGQACISPNRILVQDSIYDRLAERLSETVAALTVGRGFEPGVAQGPLINEQAVQKVERHVADAMGKGAQVRTGGARHSLGGTFYTPTVVTDVTADMLFFSEETFGPVAPLLRFSEEEEAIAIANNTPYGLAAYIFTQGLDRAWRVAEALESGMVGVNDTLISSEMVPFGGVKESGLGREGSYEGIEEYLERKYVLMTDRSARG